MSDLAQDKRERVRMRQLQASGLTYVQASWIARSERLDTAEAERDAALERADQAERELKQANFYRDRLAERLRLVEAAVLELDCAVANDTFPGDEDGAQSEEHWRSHVRAALGLCRRATKKLAGLSVSEEQPE